MSLLLPLFPSQLNMFFFSSSPPCFMLTLELSSRVYTGVILCQLNFIYLDLFTCFIKLSCSPDAKLLLLDLTLTQIACNNSARSWMLISNYNDEHVLKSVWLQRGSKVLTLSPLIYPRGHNDELKRLSRFSAAILLAPEQANPGLLDFPLFHDTFTCSAEVQGGHDSQSAGAISHLWASFSTAFNQALE